MSIPVTVKMRLGWDDESLTAPDLARHSSRQACGCDRAWPDPSARVQGDGEPRGYSRWWRLSIGTGGCQRRYPNDRRRGGHVRGNRLRGDFDRPWVAGESIHLSSARLLEPDGDPGSDPTFEERIDLMCRHFRGLVDRRGERHGCRSSARSSSGIFISRDCRSHSTYGCSISRARPFSRR